MYIYVHNMYMYIYTVCTLMLHVYATVLRDLLLLIFFYINLYGVHMLFAYLQFSLIARTCTPKSCHNHWVVLSSLPALLRKSMNRLDTGFTSSHLIEN
jgi:hypothetical protein